MTVTLTPILPVPDPVVVSPHTLVSPLLYGISNGAGLANVIAIVNATPAAAGYAGTLHATVSVPAGKPNVLMTFHTQFRDAASAVLNETSYTVLTVTTTPTTYAFTVAPAPAGTASMWVGMKLREVAAATNRQVQLARVTFDISSASATVEEIIAAPLSRPLRRTVLDVQNDDDYRINYGTPGKLAGSITYLCATLADATAVDVLYQGTSTVTLSTGSGQALDGLAHVAVGEIRYNTEKALPGKPCKWTVQAEIKEVS